MKYSLLIVLIITTAISVLLYLPQVYLIDLYLAYYNYDVTKQCVDTLWIVGQGEKDRTGYLCSGKQRGLIFTSQTNRITVYFTSKGHRFLNAKGFWLFFQGRNIVITGLCDINYLVYQIVGAQNSS